MSVINQPNVTVNKLPASVPAGVDPQVMLVIGQTLPTGSATAGALIEAVSQSQVDTLFGRNSMIAGQLRSVFDVFERAASLQLPQVDAIALDDAAGTPATASIAIAEIGGATDAATVAGTVQVIIGSEQDYAFDFNIAVGDTISTMGAAIQALINANLDIPVTALDAANTLGLTYDHDGTVGNSLTVRLKGLSLSGANNVIGNVGFTLTGFASGATDPTLTSVLDVVGSKRYQTITHPSEYGTTFSVADFLDNRWNVDNDILDGVAIIKDTDTLANLKSTANALNSQSLVILGDKTINEDTWKGAALVELDYAVSARMAAIRALRRTDDANIVRITPASTNAPLDGSGGVRISSLPYFNTPMFGVKPISTGFGFTQTEIEELFDVGVSVIGNNLTGTNLLLGEMVTTYKTDAVGNPDKSFRFLNTVDTVSASAEYMFNNLKVDFVQSRLTAGNVRQGYALVNEAAFRSQIVKYFIDLGDLLLVPTGNDAVNFFKSNLSLVINLLDGKITANNNLPIVVQLRNIIVNNKTTFDFEE
jgi:phage tail sheath gpL-like